MQVKNLKSYMMPISMILGIIFYRFFREFSFLTPFLIFLMLLISYTNISLSEVRFTKMHLYLLCIQLFGSISVYFLLLNIDPIIAQGAMICILAPTATSAVVITGMLGGNTASVTAYGLLSNITVAIVAPIFFSFLSDSTILSFGEEFMDIGKKVFIVLLLPFVISILLSRLSPKLHLKIKSAQGVSFILWNIALIIVTARTLSYLIQEGERHLTTSFVLFFLVFIICCLQFVIGRRIGRCFKDTIAGGQGLGQKNTVLSIWMAQTYLNPISSIAPGAYVLWQNMINSYQVWKKQHNK